MVQSSMQKSGLAQECRNLFQESREALNIEEWTKAAEEELSQKLTNTVTKIAGLVPDYRFAEAEEKLQAVRRIVQQLHSRSALGSVSQQLIGLANDLLQRQEELLQLYTVSDFDIISKPRPMEIQAKLFNPVQPPYAVQSDL
jgi:hypothetical protein